MASDFVAAGLLIIGSVIAWILLITIEHIISPRTKAAGMGRAPIESAERSLTASRIVGFQYYQYAIIFVVIEALFVLLFLWGENARILGLQPFIGVSIGLVFAVLLIRYLTASRRDYSKD
jgi:NADH-ubiquinone/plastoquinone oxidoreductase, chain 3.